MHNPLLQVGILIVCVKVKSNHCRFLCHDLY